MTETREPRVINVLGTKYLIRWRLEKDDPKLKDANGYTETFSKEIVICDFEPDELTVCKPEAFKQKVLRHEIIHAFLNESGLDSNSEWARNEEIVDWIALQFEKIFEAIAEADNENDG